MGFAEVARRRTRNIALISQADVTYVADGEPDSSPPIRQGSRPLGLRNGVSLRRRGFCARASRGAGRKIWNGSHIVFADRFGEPHIQGSCVVTERRPLPQHKILRLIEPFTRRGRHVDLAASDRIEPPLLFKPIVHDDSAYACAGASEGLILEDLRPNVWRVIRTVTLTAGETAKLVTEGSDLGELLDRIATVSLSTHFVRVGDVVLAQSYRLDPTARTPGAPVLMALATAEARLDGLTLSVKTSTAKGYPAEIALSPGGSAARTAGRPSRGLQFGLEGAVPARDRLDRDPARARPRTRAQQAHRDDPGGGRRASDADAGGAAAPFSRKVRSGALAGVDPAADAHAGAYGPAGGRRRAGLRGYSFRHAAGAVPVGPAGVHVLRDIRVARIAAAGSSGAAASVQRALMVSAGGA